MAEKLVVGSCGGQGGNEWSYVPKGEIRNIYITYEDVIHSISFESQDQNGIVERSNQFGTETGKINVKIELGNCKLKGISGTVDIHKDEQMITSLSFTTHTNKSYGPFGSVKGVSFSFLWNDSSSLLGNDYVISGLFGRSGLWLDAIGVYLNHHPVSPPKIIGAGPWGSHEPGNSWTYEPKGSISHLLITHDDRIHTIQFTSCDLNGIVDKSKTFGSKIGSKSNEINVDINNDEKLNKISGTYDFRDGYVTVTSLSFSTNKKKVYGPYGKATGNSFAFLVATEEFIGFHGRCGSWLDAIGVYLKPKTSEIVVGEWGNHDPGNEWSYAPKGLISQISITHNDAIYSITFTSQDELGNVEHSKKFGSMTGSKSNKIEIDIKNEKLNYISGTVGIKDGYKVITSITFKTDQKRVFGPFGVAKGAIFSLPVSNGYFSGFHGRAGSWLDAIGVYIRST